MLRNPRDWQSVLYMLAQPALVAWMWRDGFPFPGWCWPVYAVVLFLTIGVSAIHHNHAHVEMWRSRGLNRATDLWLSLLQGHPTFVFHATHNSYHHRYHHGPKDVARTYRFGGDTNHLLGYLLHPFQVLWVLLPLHTQWFLKLRRRRPGAFRYVLLQYFVVAALWIGLAIVDWRKFLLFVLLPQLHGLHWLLATNYLQHAHADGRSSINCARNFEGWVNPLMFNIGLHTAHHLHGNAHWTELPALHARYRPRVDARLHAGGLAGYMLRTFVLGLVWPRCRSESLMKAAAEAESDEAFDGIAASPLSRA
ncbi:MAG: fatty acid desaturase [Planctomycetota bacterium]|nr:fatty acid desaturase [Planctomycetota bacterium]